MRLVCSACRAAYRYAKPSQKTDRSVATYLKSSARYFSDTNRELHDAAGIPRPLLPPDLSSNIDSDAPTAAGTDAYLESRLIPPKDWANDPALARATQRALDAGIRQIQISPMQGQSLAILAKSMRAERILEVGTLFGYSTYFLTRSLPPHGQIDTLELSPLHAKLAQETFLDSDLYPFPKIHVGPALETLRTLSKPEGSGGYDLVFIDADKEGVLDYFKEGVRLCREGGVVIVDNAVRGGRIALETNDNPDIDVAGLRKLYDWVQADAGTTVLMSGIQTVGAKVWDGFAIAIKL